MSESRLSYDQARQVLEGHGIRLDGSSGRASGEPTEHQKKKSRMSKSQARRAGK